MDVNQAIKFAQLVNAAYAITPSATASSTGQVIAAGGTQYTVVSTVLANDLATDFNPSRSNSVVSIGLILQAKGGADVVIAIRGTEGIMEWVQDAKFGMIPCPFLAGAGNTEDGFTDMYRSMCCAVGQQSLTVPKALGVLPFPSPIDQSTSITICGHSLGGALVTLLALDIAANTNFKDPTVYSYASPRTGDSTFTNMYNHMVPDTYRIANRMDIVPKLPVPPLYDHVLAPNELNPVLFLPLPPKALVRPEIGCQHILTTYLHLLSISAGGTILALDANCLV
jgi:hypothetical protein